MYMAEFLLPLSVFGNSPSGSDEQIVPLYLLKFEPVFEKQKRVELFKFSTLHMKTCLTNVFWVA